MRLDGGARGEVLAGDAVWEARVVLDPRARARLAADGDGVEADGAQTLRGAVDRRRQAGRAAADHDEVEDVAGNGLKVSPSCSAKVAGVARRRTPWG